MKIYSTLHFLLILLLFPFLGCSQSNDPRTARITVHTNSHKTENVTWTQFDLFRSEPIALGQTIYKSTTKTVLAATLQHPVLAYLQVGNVGNPIYLEAGYDLHVYIENREKKPVLRFEGKGNVANNYLVRTNAIRLLSEQPGGKFYSQLTLPEFLDHIRSAEEEYTKLTNTYLQNATLTDTLKSLLIQRNQVNLLFMKQNYVLSNYSSDYANLPDSLKNWTRTIPTNPYYLKVHMLEYAMVASLYVNNSLPAVLQADKSREEIISPANQDQYPVLVEKLIQKENYPLAVQTYLLAKNIDNWLGLQGITSTIETMLTAFKTQAPNSPYIHDLERSYKKWLALAPGQPAPDFAGVTPEGRQLSLSELNGKIVYIDVWATWCGPCREELPLAKQLQQQFESNNKVAFLYVSVDQNQNAWKKMVQADPEFRGLHLNQPSSEGENSIWQAYLLGGSGIPRYILIDQAGKIVNVNAPRPSSGNVAKEI